MKREYVQPKVDIINLTSTTSFLAGSTQEGAKDEWGGEDGDDSGNDYTDGGNSGNAPADPWA